MNKFLRNILIALGILALMIITGIVVNAVKERNLVKQTTLRVEAETKIIQQAEEAKKIKSKLDSTINLVSQKQTLIDYLENNPQVIIKNNENAHLSIDKLNAYNSILRFSDNVAKYEGNRSRYGLQRFDKHN